MTVWSFGLKLSASPASMRSACANSGWNRPSLSTGPRSVTLALRSRTPCSSDRRDLIPETLSCARSSDPPRRNPHRGCARSAPLRTRARHTAVSIERRALRHDCFQIVLFLHPAGRQDRCGDSCRRAPGSRRARSIRAAAAAATSRRSSTSRSCPCAPTCRGSHSAATRRPDTRSAASAPFAVARVELGGAPSDRVPWYSTMCVGSYAQSCRQCFVTIGSLTLPSCCTMRISRMCTRLMDSPACRCRRRPFPCPTTGTAPSACLARRTA